jgi:hypothetical protein
MNSTAQNSIARFITLWVELVVSRAQNMYKTSRTQIANITCVTLAL